ncbi:MAG: hypothetical protein WD491_02620 [Balneolales bacterium]
MEKRYYAVCLEEVTLCIDAGSEKEAKQKLKSQYNIEKVVKFVEKKKKVV